MGGNGAGYTYYVDDSGIPQDGLALYSWIGVPDEAAVAVEQQWLDFRADLQQDISVPVEYELHAHLFISGRGRPGGLNPTKHARRRAAQWALDVIADLPGVSIGCVYAWEHWPRVPRETAFTGLLRTIDQSLAEQGARGHVIIDGDGTDRMYGDRHFDLDPPHIPEEPTALPAHESHWLQMADLVAYTACHAIARRPNREFMWGWYSRHLPKAEGPIQA
ncbi:DUF3800 domain-containing protein [Streptomyces sp. H27-H5]|uniref:DUF3800 domain-containing protein n=1 Tax=Streptomyces sp. H27-H5 TaxID=2996460 RepID=UPI00226F4F2C|nr:DUF3800 domain-containing protein [Streptomyces sp. H27-H5]MCY0957627.1 DUF3800 domain-containing protein [Streptomyces sp. H27-H5]